MTALERRSMIRAIIRKLRKTTLENLADKCQCSVRTIQRDIIALSTDGLPIETIRGRYDGGVKLPDWYMPHLTTLSPEQLDVLKEQAATLNGKKKQILNSVIDQFGP